uniref:Reverse transcriptase domain-containing protein n=1 Tax=Tanacetum cinerariifolium TaxID=118510 RepID=A0A6L2L7C4_TANCI|nr:hypothetical protein [Tanacetum cinerariifolium]
MRDENPICTLDTTPNIATRATRIALSSPLGTRKLRTRQNGSAFFQGEIPTKMEDPKLFTLPCRIGDSEPFDTLADLGSCINIIPLYLFKKLNIRLLEKTDHIFWLADGTKSYPVRIVDVEVHIGKLKLLNDFYVIDMKKDPRTPLLVGRGFLATTKEKPPKDKDGAWHAKIRLIDPDGEEFTKTLQSIPTTRKLSERESPRKIIDLDHLYDTWQVTSNAHVTAVKLQNDNLVGQVRELEISSTRLQEKVAAYEGFISQLEKFQDEKLEEVNEKFEKLYADFVEMALHLEEKLYLHLLTTISGRWWLLTYGMELAVAKFLNSTEYLLALGAIISKAVEKGMQEGLSARITHGAKGRQLSDVAAYNPSTEADYLSALQHLQSVNFSLIAELKSNKDASVDTIMNLLYLDDVLAERLGLTESQPHVDQLMVPIYHSPNQRIVGMEGTSGSTPDVASTLSITFVSVSTILPISTDDYEVAHANGQGARVDD